MRCRDDTLTPDVYVSLSNLLEHNILEAVNVSVKDTNRCDNEQRCIHGERRNNGGCLHRRPKYL